MGFFSSFGNKIANVADRIGHTVKSNWETIGNVGRTVNNGVGKVANVIANLTNGFDNKYVKSIHDGASTVAKYSDIVNQGMNTADKFVSTLEKSSRAVSDLGKQNISPTQFRDKMRDNYFESRNNYNDFKRR